ncbi:putative ankyrin repeat protein RF_0381 [Artemia franciscana]|uniref:putative ankyrin repeat protein RF_0381 n=1 Tax=Artemia franciscana TaxID=6661 RepID=UPI0032D9DC19
MCDNYDVNYSLIRAVRQGELERTKELINSFGLSYSKGWSEGYVLLRDALFNRKIEIAKLLLNHGCKVNSKNMSSDTPLHLAVDSSDTEVVEMILDKGAKINAVNKWGETALHCAIKNSDKNVEMTKLLLKHGSNVNVRTNYGTTPLHLAASRRCPQIVYYLLKHGADVNVIEDNGYTPLHCAAEKGSTEVVQLLLDNGANIDAKGEYNANVNLGTKKGDMPLCLSSLRGNVEICTMLLNKRANVNVKKNGGISALHIAAKNHHGNIVKLLLKYGARVNSQDDDGRTALHYACYNGHVEAVKELLEHGSDINITSKNGCTALDDNAAGIKSFYRDCNTYDSDASDYFDIYRAVFGGEITLKLIICLIVKMKTANLYVSEKNIQSMSTIRCGRIAQSIDLDDEWEMQDQYLRELARMRKEKIVNSNISFYDILVKGASSLAACMRNKNVVEISKTARYETQFPSYASIIKSQFRKGMERNNLLEPANRCFSSLFNGYTELPYECGEKILKYISNEDLKNLIDAFEPNYIS